MKIKEFKHEFSFNEWEKTHNPDKLYCINTPDMNMVNLNETNDFKVGERVLFHCFDKSTIEVMLTEVDGDLVYGVSDEGTSHWVNKKDVTKLK